MIQIIVILSLVGNYFSFPGYSQAVLLFICRIIAMCGDYYIGGRRFASLSDLIGYYSHVSCLLKGEKLLFPVAPPEASSKLSVITFVTSITVHSFL